MCQLSGVYKAKMMKSREFFLEGEEKLAKKKPAVNYGRLFYKIKESYLKNLLNSSLIFGISEPGVPSVKAPEAFL